MKSVKVSTNEDSCLFRQIANRFFEERRAISIYFDLYQKQESQAYALWYAEMYQNHTVGLAQEIQSSEEGEYGYLGDEGVVLFLLFLAEYAENP